MPFNKENSEFTTDWRKIKALSIYIPASLTSEQLEAIISALPGSRNKDAMLSANRMVQDNSYMIPPFGVTKYENSDSISWEDDQSRSFKRLIHGHTFLGCLTEAYRQTHNVKYVQKGMNLIHDWISQYPYSKSKNTMAYHDETTALRLQYWLKFYTYARKELGEEDRLVIEKQMRFTAALLAEDDFHSTNTNHGMFQDIALLLFSFYFEKEIEVCGEFKELAITRLKKYFLHIFTLEGVHKEHSPSYHFLVANNVRRIAGWLKEISPDLGKSFMDIYQGSESYATHIIRPDGYLPAIGDTEAKLVKSSGYANLYESPEYLYAVTKGEQGKPSKKNDCVFKESGYAIFRDDWTKKEEATYVLFSAAYHTAYHKHSDDLSLHIYSNGDIITEAGPNGYNYKDPYTQYAYSSFAHNTLIVDGQGLPRVDQQYDKVYIADYNLSPDEPEALGVNERFEGVKHSRNVKYLKTEKRIIVTDQIQSEQKHEYKILWHVAPDIQVYVRDSIVSLFRNEEKVAEMEFKTTSPIRVQSIQGQTKPTLQGWFFPKMESKQEATVIEVELSGANVTCTTEFRLSSFKINKEGKDLFKRDNHFISTDKVRYHLVPAEDKNLKDQLIIIFSALSPKYGYVYNYMKTLDGIKANKLFILDDFGDQGAYYLGKDRNHSIESTVASLIQYIMSKYQIPHKNVTTVGSSKGGYAALYYGIKYFLGNIVAGAPQSKLGNFLIKQAKHHNIAEYIAGGTEEGDCYYLNNVLYRLLEQPVDVSPKIHLYVGTGDHHYKNHVMPLQEMLSYKGYDVKLDIEENITHEDLKTYFPHYLKKTVSSILNIRFVEEMTPEIKSITIQQRDQELIVNCEAIGLGLEYAYYFYKDEDIIEKFFYRKPSQLTYRVTEPGSYKCRVFVRDSKMQKTSQYTHNISI
ncbi:heparinase II/III domain-containing protein [Peribacillus frigoritolerans]